MLLLDNRAASEFVVKQHSNLFAASIHCEALLESPHKPAESGINSKATLTNYKLLKTIGKGNLTK